ncbi:MAG: hypothetical protein KKE24_05845 [Candidatus Thermoplasmatota archaeon]|nr:hypothetical protein [Candidatus Thermoplasmatota archaeon]
MTGIPDSGSRDRPDRYQQYTLFDVVDRLHDIENRIEAIESGIEEQKEREYHNYVRNTGIAFVTLSLAGYSLSLALPDSSYGLISTVVGIAGIILVYVSLFISRKRKGT